MVWCNISDKSGVSTLCNFVGSLFLKTFLFKRKIINLILLLLIFIFLNLITLKMLFYFQISVSILVLLLLLNNYPVETLGILYFFSFNLYLKISGWSFLHRFLVSFLSLLNSTLFIISVLFWIPTLRLKVIIKPLRLSSIHVISLEFILYAVKSKISNRTRSQLDLLQKSHFIKQ